MRLPSQSLVIGKTLGAQPVTVSSVGRHCQAGNSLTHELRLIRASDNATLASVNVSMSGCTAVQFKYGTLASPVTLAANTAYLVVSYEVAASISTTGPELSCRLPRRARSIRCLHDQRRRHLGTGGRNGQQLRAAGPAVPDGSLATANVKWLVADQLGTPRMVFDQTGALDKVKRHDYLPFGEELFAGQGLRTSGANGLGYDGDNIRQQFTSYEGDDETNLDFAQARYYGSTLGRFTSADPRPLNQA